MGHRSFQLKEFLKSEGGPSLYWSIYDQNYERKWRQAFENAPYFKEATIALDQGDVWHLIKADGGITKDSTIDLADNVSDSIVEFLGQMLS